MNWQGWAIRAYLVFADVVTPIWFGAVAVVTLAFVGGVAFSLR